MRIHSYRHSYPRPGFTRSELILTVIAIVVLATLLSPAIFDVRGRTKTRLESLTNLKNVGLAVANYSSVHGGTVPPLIETHGIYGVPRTILTFLDEPGLDRTISNGGQPEVFVKVFASVGDEFNFNRDRGLTTRFNAGWGDFIADSDTGRTKEIGLHDLDLDWDGDGEVTSEDRLAMRATGVFWRLSNDVAPLTLDDIGESDGISQTLMLTENFHPSDWLSNETLDLGFVVGREALTIDFEQGMLAVTEFRESPYRVNGVDPSQIRPTPGPSASHREIGRAHV